MSIDGDTFGKIPESAADKQAAAIMRKVDTLLLEFEQRYGSVNKSVITQVGLDVLYAEISQVHLDIAEQTRGVYVVGDEETKQALFKELEVTKQRFDELVYVAMQKFPEEEPVDFVHKAEAVADLEPLMNEVTDILEGLQQLALPNTLVQASYGQLITSLEGYKQTLEEGFKALSQSTSEQVTNLQVEQLRALLQDGLTTFKEAKSTIEESVLDASAASAIQPDAQIDATDTVPVPVPVPEPATDIPPPRVVQPDQDIAAPRLKLTLDQAMSAMFSKQLENIDDLRNQLSTRTGEKESEALRNIDDLIRELLTDIEAYESGESSGDEILNRVEKNLFKLEERKQEGIAVLGIDKKLQKPEAVDLTSEQVRLQEYFARWQQGDPTLLDKGWQINFRKIQSDLAKMVTLAGYSNSEHNSIYQAELRPVIERVYLKRKHKLRDVNYSVLETELLSAMQKILAGREIVPERLQRYRESTMSASVDSDDSGKQEAYTVEELDGQINDLLIKLDKLEQSLAPLNDETVERRVFYARQALKKALDFHSDDATEVLHRKDTYLKTAKRNLQGLLQAEQYVAYEDVDDSLNTPPTVVPQPDTTEASYLDLYVNDPLMKDTAVPNQPAPSGLDPAFLTVDPAAPVPPLSGDPVRSFLFPDAKGSLDSNPGMADMWRQSRREFAEIKQKRNEALAAYYEKEANSFSGKLRSAGKIFGLKPQLPQEIIDLEGQYKVARQTHAGILSHMDRVKSKFAIDTERGKQAFGRHFIVNDHARQLKMQESIIERLDAQKVVMPAVRKTLTQLSKYKWHRRVGTVVAVGALGAVTGGLAAGGIAALTAGARMSASIGGGALAGWATREVMQDRVDRKEKEKDETLGKVESDFSLDALAELEEEFKAADEAYRLSEKQKDVATVVAAGATGLGFGFGFNATVAPEIASTMGVGGKSHVEVGVSKPNPEMSAGSDAGGNMVDRGSEVVRPLVQVGEVKVSGTRLGEQVISNIEIRGIASLGKSEMGPIPDAAVRDVFASVRLAARDIVEANPHTPKAEVERILFEKMQQRYGDTSWWKEAEITEVKIGSIEVVPAAPGAAEAHAAVESAPKLTPEQLSRISAELPDVLTKEFGHILQELSPGAQKVVLAMLVERVQSDVAFRESIGFKVSPDGRIDWTNENTNLGVLATEMVKLVKIGSDNPPEAPSKPATGKLSIQSVDSESFEKQIQIAQNSVMKPVTPAEIAQTYTEAKPTASASVAETLPKASRVYMEKLPEASKPPLASVPDGKFFSSPAYKEYLAQNGVSEAMIEKRLGSIVSRFEGRTQSFWNELVNSYESPFEKLSHLTIKEINELRAQFAESPTALREYAEQNNFNEATLRAWSTQFDQMAKIPYLPFNEKTTLKDWVMRDVAQRIIQDKSSVPRKT